jgi:hypothetical protein
MTALRLIVLTVESPIFSLRGFVKEREKSEEELLSRGIEKERVKNRDFTHIHQSLKTLFILSN